MTDPLITLTLLGIKFGVVDHSALVAALFPHVLYNVDEDRYATDAEILSHVHNLPPQEVVTLIKQVFNELENTQSKTAQEVS